MMLRCAIGLLAVLNLSRAARMKIQEPVSVVAIENQNITEVETPESSAFENQNITEVDTPETSKESFLQEVIFVDFIL